jgi:hypothetical protein
MCYHRISLREAIVILAVCLYLLVISAGNARADGNVDVLPLWQQGLARPWVPLYAVPGSEALLRGFLPVRIG